MRIYRTRIRRRRAAGLLLIIAAIAAGLGYQSLAPSSSSPAASTLEALRGERGAPGDPPGRPREGGGPLGEADGAVPEGATVFDDSIPGVANLDADLLAALREAAADAAEDGTEFFVTSGWRSAAYQERLLQEAVSEYGSEAEAARWVATPETSPHVAGEAVDVGSDAATWLSTSGSAYGLCQIYGNERWHYELRPEAVTQGCPSKYADPTGDPRMQQ